MTDMGLTAPAPPGRGLRRLRPGLVDLYLLRGVAGPFLAIVAAVGAALMLERALRLVHDLAASGADIGYFFPLLVRMVPYYLDLTLPAAFMVALVLLVARLDDRLELEAMLASGLSLTRIAAPLVALGVLIGAAGLATSGWLEPVGAYSFRAMRIEAINAGRLARLEPRAIYHPADSLAVTFDRRSGDDGIEGVFVWQRLADGRELVLTGRSGRIGFSARRRLFGIDLGPGRYVAARPGASGSAPDLVAFDTLAFRESLRLRDSSWQRGWDQNEMTLNELHRALAAGTGNVPRPRMEAEYYSRIARAAILPLLPLLVLPLAFATKRGGRGLGLLLCGTILVAIHHALNLARSLAMGGVADARAAVLGTAGLCAAIVLLVFVSGRHLPSHSPISGVLKRLTDRAARLAPRARTLPSLRGRTVATYLAWQLSKWTALALLAVVALLQMVELLERGDDFVERGMGLADVGRYALLRLPAMLQQGIPIAALAGAMTTFAGLGRHHEMTAIRAAGISQWRILAMALPVPLLLSLAAFFLADDLAPQSQLRLAAWWSETAPARASDEPTARWFRIGDEIVRAGGASADGRRLDEVGIFRRDSAGLLVERVSARTATAGPNGWTLSGVGLARIASGRLESATSARRDWHTPLQPSDVAAFFTPSRALSASAARRSLEASAPISQGGALFATRLYRSAAEPLAPMLMLLLALPLAFLSPRSSLRWPAFLYAGGGGLFYLVADGVLTVAGQVGYLPAAVGAWAAPVMAALIGFTVLLYGER